MPQDRPKSIFGGFGALLEAPWDDFRGTDLVPDLDQDPDPDQASDPDHRSMFLIKFVVPIS